ncbi:MAG: hypothetical protein K2X39_03155 [Silvanigrellaceae bacterium]|nr:hypothetical protein [Silvanigrellaceae bacterium]
MFFTKLFGLYLLFYSLFAIGYPLANTLASDSNNNPLLDLQENSFCPVNELSSLYFVVIDGKQLYLMGPEGEFFPFDTAGAPLHGSSDVVKLTDSEHGDQETQSVYPLLIEPICLPTEMGNSTYSVLSDFFENNSIHLDTSQIQEALTKKSDEGKNTTTKHIANEAYETYLPIFKNMISNLNNPYLALIFKVHMNKYLAELIIPSLTQGQGLEGYKTIFPIEEPLKILIKGIGNSAKIFQAGKGIHLIPDAFFKAIYSNAFAVLLTKVSQVSPILPIILFPFSMLGNYFIEHHLSKTKFTNQYPQQFNILKSASETVNRGNQIVIRKILETNFKTTYPNFIGALKGYFPESSHVVLNAIVSKGYASITNSRYVALFITSYEIISDSFSAKPKYNSLYDKTNKFMVDMVSNEINSWVISTVIALPQFFLDSKKTLQLIILFNLVYYCFNNIAFYPEFS